ncbi:hypothetical protein [Thiohalocapsa sp. ML1]|jgi:hypothetical protein|uniref:hypothetical protein n=1 Tax=Thiohalocapsa sp. ML1 TaxID=1431688 RepID=UPI0007323FDE|nr:hypothetical protein [Thiohalocapsa sp. ML1]
MAYSIDLRNAAHRHLNAANALFDKAPHEAVSGYLYGIAAECAIKAMMQQAGMQPLDRSKRRKDDPFFAHFPDLRIMLEAQAQTRLGGTLRRFIADPNFMSQWDTTMRYAPGSEVHSKWVEKWREQARQVVSSIDT